MHLCVFFKKLWLELLFAFVAIQAITNLGVTAQVGLAEILPEQVVEHAQKFSGLVNDFVKSFEATPRVQTKDSIPLRTLPEETAALLRPSPYTTAIFDAAEKHATESFAAIKKDFDTTLVKLLSTRSEVLRADPLNKLRAKRKEMEGVYVETERFNDQLETLKHTGLLTGEQLQTIETLQQRQNRFLKFIRQDIEEANIIVERAEKKTGSVTVPFRTHQRDDPQSLL